MSVETAREWVTAAERVVVLTGAGISADSGIPTFRGGEGLWRNFRAEDLATPQAFSRDPRMVWEWYNWRRELIASKLPNSGHEALARLEERTVRRGGSFCLVTQNVDGLHSMAGSRHPLEIHGSIWRVRCASCGHEAEDRRATIIPLPPRCHFCGGILRPAVVWFGEALDPGIWEEAVENARKADLLLAVGTSGVVFPAAGLAAEAVEAKTIEINLEPSGSDFDLVLQGRAAQLLPEIIAMKEDE